MAREPATNSNRASRALGDVLRRLTQPRGRRCRGTPDLSNGSLNLEGPIQLVAVATVHYVNYINLFIYMCTQSLLKSLDNKALHIVPL
jgi:hypothetical protein